MTVKKKSASWKRSLRHQLKLKQPGRTLLRQIVKFLNTDKTGDAKKLWDVLTALRGPDDENQELKAATTGVIRHQIGLKGKMIWRSFRRGRTDMQGMRWGNTYFMIQPDEQKYVDLRRGLVRTHFTDHTGEAFGALGLDYYDLNQ